MTHNPKTERATPFSGIDLTSNNLDTPYHPPERCALTPALDKDGHEVTRSVASIPVTYTAWLVAQATHVQEELLGVDRAAELRKAYAKVQRIAGGCGEEVGDGN